MSIEISNLFFNGQIFKVDLIYSKFEFKAKQKLQKQIKLF